MKTSRILKMREAWVACFLLGVVMLNYPFLEIFNKDVLIVGIPLSVLYILVGWPFSIGVIYLFTRHFDFDSSKDSDREKD
mgnify:CR=1 FL=1